jgi:hypothetical protein
MGSSAKGNLGKWFREQWVDISRKKGGKHPPCGRPRADGSPYPKCRPAAKAAKMSAAQKKASVARKRARPQGVGGKPTYVR